MYCRPSNILVAAALLTVAACEGSLTTTPVIVAPERPAAPILQPAPATPAIEPLDTSDLAVDPISGLPDPAVATCMSEVAQASGEGTVAPVRVEEGLTGQTVTIAAGEERAPWQCRVNASGGVSVSPTGATGQPPSVPPT